LIGDIVFASALAGLAGARLFHILDNTDQFLANPLAMIFSRGGFSIYGGLLAGIVVGISLLRRRGLPVAPVLDAIAPALMLGYAIGRLGCQLSGDGDWGIPADMALKPAWIPVWLWAQTYDGNILGIAIPYLGVYPTPLYESAAALLLFGVLHRCRLVHARPGYLFSCICCWPDSNDSSSRRSASIHATNGLASAPRRPKSCRSCSSSRERSASSPH
jgi:phosphatidylglycerol:prolipoprotein diacylglycerol transferase